MHLTLCFPRTVLRALRMPLLGFDFHWDDKTLRLKATSGGKSLFFHFQVIVHPSLREVRLGTQARA